MSNDNILFNLLNKMNEAPIYWGFFVIYEVEI